MDNMSINLNDRLAHASKKFTKACDQIKLLKQRIAELIQMFSYCEQNSSIINSTTSQINDNNLSNNNNNNLNSSISINNHDFIRQTCQDQNINLNKNLFKETIRQQIENLQSIKNAYFMYAHKKADEITKLQCELYGEDAVREAYEMASPEALLPVSSSSSNISDQEVNNEQETQQNNNEPNNYNEFNNNTDNNLNESDLDINQINLDQSINDDFNNITNSSSINSSILIETNDLNENNLSNNSTTSNVNLQNYWAPWDLSQQVQDTSFSNFSSSANSSMLNQDFLIA